jgi:hypothetical protein
MVTVPRMSLFTCRTLMPIMSVGLVDLENVRTGDMLADGLTKALPLRTENFVKPWGCTDPGYNGAWDLFRG